MIQVLLDVPQSRTQLSSLRGLDYGATWDLTLGGNVVMDYSTLTPILAPLCLTDAWLTPTGDTERLRKANFDVSGALSPYWTEAEVGYSGNWYLVSLGTAYANNFVETTMQYDANRALYASFFTPNWGQTQGTAIQLGWISTDATLDNLHVNVLNNGHVQVYHGTVFAGQQSITAISRIESVETRMDELETQYGAISSGDGAPVGRDITNQYQSILIYPRPYREIVVYSPSAGGGFCMTIPSMPPYEGSGETRVVTPPGWMFFKVPEGQAICQLWPVKFAESGTVVSQPHVMYYAPGTAQAGSATLYGAFLHENTSLVGSAVLHPYTGAAFASDGTANQYRMQCVLTGNKTHTPYLIGASNVWPGLADDTYDGSIDVTPWVSAKDGITISVPETASGVEMNMTLLGPEDLSASAASPDTTYNRPIRLDMVNWDGGTVTVFEGSNEPPEIEYREVDFVTGVKMKCRDQWYKFENHVFTDPMVLDGMVIGTAIYNIATECGWASDAVDIDYIDQMVPGADNPANGQWGHVIKAGETAAKWLEKLHKDYAPTWFMGIKPGSAGPILYFKDPEVLGTVPVGTVYPTVAEAGGDLRRVVRKMQERRLRPLANEVIVEGLRPFLNERVTSRWYDVDSYVASTEPASRPTNWIGEQRIYIYQNPRLQNENECSLVAAHLLDRLCDRPYMLEIECEMQFKSDGLPVWRGDALQVGTIGIFRVQSLEAKITYAGTAFSAQGSLVGWRPTTYVLEHLP